MEKEPVPCPYCKATVTIPGVMGAPDGTARFTPAWSLVAGRGICVPLTCRACLSCGMVWMSLDPGDLRRQAHACTNELGGQYLDGVLEGPYRDLPNAADAREVGDLIAELDSLLVFGRQGEATRLYRERIPCTWDQAVDRIRRWPGMKRAEKLQHFGWGPKHRTKDELFLEEHPLRDPWLDGEALARHPSSGE